jgi:hypothetical protein
MKEKYTLLHLLKDNCSFPSTALTELWLTMGEWVMTSMVVAESESWCSFVLLVIPLGGKALATTSVSMLKRH